MTLPTLRDQPPQTNIEVRIVDPDQLARLLAHRDRPGDELVCWGQAQDLRWLAVLERGLGHQPFLLEAREGQEAVGRLPLAFVKSALFGRFLISLPYLNSAGLAARSSAAAIALVDRAAALADQLDVRYLELRHERPLEHSALTRQMTHKVHMRLALPSTPDALWNQLKAKVRNQVRKGREYGLAVQFGRQECLADFYRVFSRNMRDLGTPVFGRRLFEEILAQLGPAAELCIVRREGTPVAAALLVHRGSATEVPSASSLREHNVTSANMLMYWHLLERAIERGQTIFDFGRSTVESNTYRFKKQWGAVAEPAAWQYYLRKGDIGHMRPESSRYGLLISAWRRLPLWLANRLGPDIVRGIP